MIELDSLLTAYPGNAAMHQLKCEILLRPPADRKPGTPVPPPDKTARAACTKAADLAAGDPAPHISVAEALLVANDGAGARAELVLAEDRIKNLEKGQPE